MAECALKNVLCELEESEDGSKDLWRDNGVKSGEEIESGEDSVEG